MLNGLEGTTPLLDIIIECLEREGHEAVSFLFIFKGLLVHVKRLLIFGGHAQEGRLEVIVNEGFVEDIILVGCDLTQTSASEPELLVSCLVKRHPITKDLLLLIV